MTKYWTPPLFSPKFFFTKMTQNGLKWILNISRGKKTLFFKKCPNNGLVSEKKYIGFFFTVGGGESDQSVKNFADFFFFNEGFPKYWDIQTMFKNKI